MHTSMGLPFESSGAIAMGGKDVDMGLLVNLRKFISGNISNVFFDIITGVMIHEGLQCTRN